MIVTFTTGFSAQAGDLLGVKALVNLEVLLFLVSFGNISVEDII